MVVADVVASKLKCELDVLIPSKVNCTHNKEIAIGAMAEDGVTIYLNGEIIRELDVSGSIHRTRETKTNRRNLTAKISLS